GNSKGALEWKNLGPEPDWTAWFPWRMGAKDYQQAVTVLNKFGGEHPKPHLVPFGAQGKPKKDRKFWYVNDYSHPVVSVIVTVGPGHEALVTDALDSIQAQTYPDWECVVVNDTGTPWPTDLMGAPWAQVVNMDGNRGAAAARNEGFRHTRGKLIVWMDADDYWMPWFLDVMVAHAEQNDGVIFSDLIMENDGLKILRYQEFDSTRVPMTMQYAGSSVLTPRKVVEKVIEWQGGWDEKTPGMEDWDWQVAVHHLGFCAYHVSEPLFVYRMKTSTKRESDYAKIELIRAYMDEKWRVYRKGERQLMCGCSGKKPVKSVPKSTMSSSGTFDQSMLDGGTELASQMVQLEYVGPIEQTFSLRSRVMPGQVYRFGNNTHHKVQTVLMGDAEYFTGMRDGENRPLYSVVSARAMMETRDPSAFLGAAVG
ncbi:MAG: glycosyltransferase family 2 protein, partial [Gammaproteobacteria bacterium]|nr:glycosyltransferase family 2 protein [Gammaproteobacteria bacterium]